MFARISTLLTILICFAVASPAEPLTNISVARQRGYEYLRQVMDQCHIAFYVYRDADDACNHFFARGKISTPGLEDAVPPMDERFLEESCGRTCILARFLPRGITDHFGGWYFLNGVLTGRDRNPRLNWGEVPNAGVDLRGATRVRIRAKGERGGEVVQFFALGVGWSSEQPLRIERYPDSAYKRSKTVTLSRNWATYEIDLSSADLSYVLGGFGWAADSRSNNFQPVSFLIDQIEYDKSRLDEPRLLVSYETEPPLPGDDAARLFDKTLVNTAFLYDNSLALIAFLVNGDLDRARLIADAMIAVQEKDRFFDDGRIRNGPKGGDIALPPGWEPRGRKGTVPMAGWYDAAQGGWFEDEFNVSTATGNVAWSMLGLLSYFETAGGEEYLAAAERMGRWVVENTWDTTGAGGFIGSFDGWEPDAAPTGEITAGQTKRTYKATEHNIDLYAAFFRLDVLTSNGAWRGAADHAKNFLLAMWDVEEQKFFAGTDESGVAVDRRVIPLDAQPWSVLALGEEGRNYTGGLRYAELNHRVGEGFGFKQNGTNRFGDKVWYEGTGQMAVAYRTLGNTDGWERVLEGLIASQLPDGSLPAANEDKLDTGFDLNNGEPWLYFRRKHIGATSWFLLAASESPVNPFWVGSEPPKGDSERPVIRWIGNGASYVANLAPGANFTIFGKNFGINDHIAQSAPLPTQLGRVEVLFNEIAVPLFYVGQSQINGQVPYELPEGRVTVRVVVAGEQSDVTSLTIKAAALGLYRYGSGFCVAQDAAGALIGLSNPAAPGSIVVAYGTGAGRVDQAVLSGHASPSSPLARPLADFKANVGGKELGVEFIGLSPGLVGVSQANLRLPEAIEEGIYNLLIQDTGEISLSTACRLAISRRPLAELPVPTGFEEPFSGSTLNPAWQLRPGQGAASAAERPGFLRYRLTGATSTPQQSTWVHRPFQGTQWYLESKIEYQLPAGSGRQLYLRVLFGDLNQYGVSEAVWWHDRDDGGGSARLRTIGQFVDGGVSGGVPGNGFGGDPSLGFAMPTNSQGAYWVRIIRNGQHLTIQRSDDGVAYQTVVQRQFTTSLGTMQTVLLAGNSFAGGGGLADYDYINVRTGAPPPAPTPEPPSVPAGFEEPFSGSTLNPAWQLRPGQGAASAAERPGFLRYRLTGATSTPQQSTWVHRPFQGTQWYLESKIEYQLPAGSGRQLYLRVLFGDLNQYGVSEAVWWHDRDDGGGSARLRTIGQFVDGGVSGGVPGNGFGGDPSLGFAMPTNSQGAYWVRIIRNGQHLTIQRSDDGVAYQTVVQRQFTTSLGTMQTVLLAGNSFAGGGGLADYDYINVRTGAPPPAPTPEPPSVPAGFEEPFSGSTLNPAWQLRPGQGAASAAERPGFLRYRLTGATSTPQQSTWVHRPFQGTQWYLESKIEYQLPAGSGRQLYLRVLFGDLNQYGVSEAVWWHDRDDGGGSARLRTIGQFVDGGVSGGVPGNGFGGDPSLGFAMPTNSQGAYWVRIIRNGQHLTIQRSDDGVAYQTVVQRQFTTSLGTMQTVLLAGNSFAGGGGLADYDYINVRTGAPPPAPTPEPPSVPAGFEEPFSGSTLNPAWQLRPGQGAASAAERPGFLRYRLTGATSTPQQSTWVHRPFQGTQWYLESKIEYQLPAGSGRQLYLRVLFGDLNQYGVSEAVWWHDRDDGGGSARLRTIGQFVDGGVSGGVPGNGFGGDPSLGFAMPTNSQGAYWVRIIRNGQHLTIQRSDDGVAYQTVVQRQFTTSLGTMQTVLLAGNSFAGGGGLADYDYINVRTGAPPPE